MTALDRAHPEATGEVLAERLRQLGVLQHGHFRLSSGAHSDTYLQLALALQHPAFALELGEALAARARTREPDVVASPALGGVLAGFVVAAALGVRFVFAERTAEGGMVLRRGQGCATGERVLVVEDVVTTGGSAREVERLVTEAGAEVVGLAAIVDRSAGLPADKRPERPPTALLAVEAATWDPEVCPRCAEGSPIDTPGSRVEGQGGRQAEGLGSQAEGQGSQADSPLARGSGTSPGSR